MQSFLKCITEVNAPIANDWVQEPDTAFRALDTVGKTVFLVGQAVMLNYLTRVYDGGLPLLIKEYKTKVAEWWLPDLETALATWEPTALELAPDVETVKLVFTNLHSLLGLNDQPVDAELLIEFLAQTAAAYQDQLPMPSKASFYSSYLKFIERARRSEASDMGDYAQTVESFRDSGTVTLPLASYRGDLLVINSDKVNFTSYAYDYKANHEFGQQPYSLGVESIFAYWRGYNWRGFSFNELVGVLLAQCLELDPNTYSSHSLLWGYAQVYRQVMHWQPEAERGSNLWLSSESNLYRHSILYFLTDICKKYQIPLDDSELLARLVKDTVEDAEPISAYLTTSQPSDVSVEMYQAFQNSIFADFEELQVANHQSSLELMQAAICANRSGLNTSLTQQDRRASQRKLAKDLWLLALNWSDTQFGLEADNPTQPADAGTKAADESDSTNSPQSADNDQGDRYESNFNDAGTTTPDAEPTEPDTNSPEVPDDTSTHTEDTPASDTRWMNDDRGVELELSTGENTNSVLFKMELEAYIDSLLANPPNSLSVMKIEVLKRIKAYWLHFLTMECLLNLVNNIIELPKHLNLQPKDKQDV